MEEENRTPEEIEQELISEVAQKAKEVLLRSDGAFVVSYVVRRVVPKNVIVPDERAAILHALNLQQEADYNQAALVLKSDMKDYQAEEFDTEDEAIDFVLDTNTSIQVDLQ